MAKTKGVSVTNLREFLGERFGADAWEKLMQALPAADRDVACGVTSSQWIELELYVRLLNTTDAEFGAGDRVLLGELGAWGAERDLNSAFRILLRVVSPAYLLKKTAQLWRRYHDSGTWQMDAVAGGARGRLEGLGVVDRALCAELTGYFPRLVELVGGRDVSCQHTACRADGAPACEFSARWK